MVTLCVLLIIAGVLMACLSGICAILIDPLIAIFSIVLIFKLIKKIRGKK